MVKNSSSINLLKSDKNETLEQVMNWSLTIGRILIIGVELIALLAFLYRFSLDSQLQDLSTQIKQRQTIVDFQKQNENTYRNLQQRLKLISDTSVSGAQTVKIYYDILGFAPAGMIFNNVTLSDNNILIEANINSITPLGIFTNVLKKYSSVESISIDKIQNNTTSSTITANISINLKKKGVANAASAN